MAYSAWSVVFGEQWLPSAAKWNILGTNDASFNDGTGIFGLKKDLLTTDSNPYKFSAYRNAAHNSASSYTLVQHDAVLFDTNNNFDITTNKGRYTAPVDGFYFVSACTGNSTATGTIINSAIYKNGAVALQGSYSVPSTAPNLSVVSGLIQMTAGQYIEHYFVGGNGSTQYTSSYLCYFHGFLVSRT